MRNVKIKIVNEQASIPAQGSAEAAGFDLVACLPHDVTLSHGQLVSVPTGIKLAAEATEQPYCYFICGRSGLGTKHGITLANCVGVIDADYRGELVVGLINNSNEDYTIHPGDRIAQLIFIPIETMNFIVSDELEETSRGSGGFGSTGN